MASKDTQIGEADEKVKMLKEALKCVNGTLDFDKLATEMNVANAEAMRKRFKRVFEKDEEPIQIKGSTLGNTEEGATVAKALRTPRTPKTKAVKLANSGDDSVASPTTKSAGSKRRAVEVSKGDDEDISKAVSGKKSTVTNKTVPAADEAVAPESPKKKIKTTPTKPRKSAKAPQTPPTTKPPGTPKAPLSRGARLNMEDSDDEGVKKSGDHGSDNPTNLKEHEDAKTDDAVVGSPAISAKTDVLIKATEAENGGPMGEPAKQAKRDAVKSAMKG